MSFKHILRTTTPLCRQAASTRLANISPVRNLASIAARPRSHGVVTPRADRGVRSVFDDFFDEPFFRPFFQPATMERISMGLDVQETADKFIVKADLPGVKKEDVKVTCNENVLQISAERKEEHMDTKETQVHYSDFSYGKIQRSLRLPDTADKSQIQATMDNGVLTIKLKKQEHAKEQEIKIT